MKSYQKKFTPEECVKLLEATDFQRPVNQRNVDALARAMAVGEFRVNGETIILNGTKVLDGQHRLWACVQSGVPFESWVVEGVPDKHFATIDTGKARNAADTICISRGKGAVELPSNVRSPLAAAIQYVILTEPDGRLNTGKKGTVANSEVRAFFEAHGEIVDDALALQQLGRWPLPLSMCIYLLYMVEPGFPNALSDFFGPLQSGAGLFEGSPILLLRNKAMASPRPSDFHAKRDILGNLIKAWNFFATKTDIKVLRFSAGVEAFPTIVLKLGVRAVNRKKA